MATFTVPKELLGAEKDEKYNANVQFTNGSILACCALQGITSFAISCTKVVPTGIWSTNIAIPASTSVENRVELMKLFLKACLSDITAKTGQYPFLMADGYSKVEPISKKSDGGEFNMRINHFAHRLLEFNLATVTRLPLFANIAHSRRNDTAVWFVDPSNTPTLREETAIPLSILEGKKLNKVG